MAGNDLFVMMDNSKFNDVLEAVEARVTALVTHRHMYPIWPTSESPMDSFEREYHGPIRSTYYGTTVFLIQVLRKLRNIS